MSYRSEIDGLRAIAVVSVILYHAQIVIFGRDWFEGGFIGVDIFFVISGYLITRIILTELEQTNTFSFMKFYERRARRILPMLFLVIVACIPFAWQQLLPLDLVDFAKSALSAIGFGSNFFFYYSTTEYGADSALLKPLLHTWSLGVEEQFYIVVPIIILIIWKFARASLLAVLIGMLIMSILFSDIMEVRNSELNFFLPFSRFWELLVGSVLAFLEVKYGKVKNALLGQILPIIGLFLIAHSFIFFGSDTPHPSFYTIIPITGVALIIGFCSADYLVGKVLSFKPIVGIGLISYSLYLWHFPIFAFSRYAKPLQNSDKLELIALAFGLSIFSYLIVEKTFRNKKVVNFKSLSKIIFVFLCIILANLYWIIEKDGFSNRHQEGKKVFSNYTADRRTLFKNSWRYLDVRKNEISQRERSADILIVGNSHSRDTFNMLDSIRGNFENHIITRYGDSDFNMQISCFNETVNDYSPTRDEFYSSEEYSEAKIIIVSTYWGEYPCTNASWPKTHDFDGLGYLAKKIANDGKQIIVFSQSPTFNKIGEEFVIDHFVNNALQNSNFNNAENVESVNALLFYKRHGYYYNVNEKLDKITKNLQLPFFPQHGLLCDEQMKYCHSVTDDEFRVLTDLSHLSMEGVKFLGKKLVLKPEFETLKNLFKQ